MDESDLLFRVFTNSIKMLRDRGYIIPPEFDPTIFTKDAFLLKYGTIGDVGVVFVSDICVASNDMGIVQRDDVKIRFVHQTERYRLLLLFVKCTKLGKKEVEAICGRLDEVKVSTLPFLFLISITDNKVCDRGVLLFWMEMYLHPREHKLRAWHPI
jgi:hypothetical protein